METGEAEIDFTEDGSLEALERKLSAQRYHILHFSGHAVFKEKDNTGYLQLENPVNLSPDLEYETTAYQLAMETKDAMGIYHVGKALGHQMAKQGMKKEGVHLLKQSLEIGKAAGFPDVGVIEEILRELGSA